MADDRRTDETKGRLKEAAGSLTGDDDLKGEGQDDRRKADAKETIDKASDKAKDALDSVTDRLKG